MTLPLIANIFVILFNHNILKIIKSFKRMYFFSSVLKCNLFVNGFIIFEDLSLIFYNMFMLLLKITDLTNRNYLFDTFFFSYVLMMGLQLYSSQYVITSHMEITPRFLDILVIKSFFKKNFVIFFSIICFINSSLTATTWEQSKCFSYIF